MARGHDEIIERANPSGVRVCAALNSLIRRKARKGLGKLKGVEEKSACTLGDGNRSVWADEESMVEVLDEEVEVGISNPEKGVLQANGTSF